MSDFEKLLGLGIALVLILALLLVAVMNVSLIMAIGALLVTCFILLVIYWAGCVVTIMWEYSKWNKRRIDSRKRA